MRLGGRLSAAIDVLSDIDTRSRPVSEALKDWAAAHRFAGSGDRSAIGNLVYDALRMRLSHAYLMDNDSSRMLAHAVLFRQWGYSPEVLAQELAGDTFAPPPLAESELSAFRSRSLESAPPHVKADIPEWIADRFAEAFGANWIAEAQAFAERPPLDLRVNTLRSTAEKVERALARVRPHRARIARNGLRIAPGQGPVRLPNVTADPAFEKGWFEVQDEGSQIVAELVQAAAGEQVLDFCAGGGGKSLALAAAMENKGQVHAYDADRRRLAPIVERLRRAATRNVQVHSERNDLAPLIERCDRVLVDAPCTGSGTWRRRPDTKWRLTDRNLAERVSQQAEVLSEGAQYVRKGGVLVYVTCSVFPDENDRQIARFLEAHGGFTPIHSFDTWRALYGDEVSQPACPSGDHLLLSPRTTQTDGFFFAALQRSTD